MIINRSATQFTGALFRSTLLLPVPTTEQNKAMTGVQGDVI